ncbi:MAG: hypothetical protein WBQ95_17265 [Terracidiphilus sp.]
MKRLSLPLFLLLTSTCVCAQDGTAANSPGNFYARWSAQTSAIQSHQPGWAVPLVTTYTGLFQVVRTDVVRQIAPAGTDTWNFDNSKGFNLIVPGNLEFDVNLPPYIQHNSTAKDGAGDMSFLAKYRIISGNEHHGAYTVSAFMLATIPTGSYKNGSTNAALVPSIGIGKGFGSFDVQSTLGATLPTGNPAILASGRPIGWNVAGQYKLGKLLWPEIESNATFFKGGPHDGKTQEFITPGLLIGKCGLHPSDKKSRPGLAFGGGMQIATSQLHTYNHALILTGRWIY